MDEIKYKVRELVETVEIKGSEVEHLTLDFTRSVAIQGATADVEPIFNDNMVRIGSKIKVYVGRD